MKDNKHIQSFKEFNENLNISDGMNSKSFTYDEVHKLLRNFNFQFAWIEPEKFEKWIIENVK